MRGVRLHAALLALALILLGGGSIYYQNQVLSIPFFEGETDEVWVIDARLVLDAGDVSAPLKVAMFVPPPTDRYIVLSENFISRNYGFNVGQVEGNRQVTWSSRRARGEQVLYYRKTLSRRFATPGGEAEGPQFRPRPPLQGAERLAAEALLEPIRQRSADVESFISETIRTVNEREDDNVRLLLSEDDSEASRARVVELLLGSAHIPAEKVHVLRLSEAARQTPELWLRSYAGERWVYFHPRTGQQGLPDDRLIWWVGNQPLVQLEGGSDPQVRFSVSRSEVNAIQLAQTSPTVRERTMLHMSMYELPVGTQDTYKVVLLLPFGVMLILLLRNLVGIETLGTFAPILVALAFRETEVIWGIIFFSTITAMGLALRAWLEHLHLQLLSRLSVVLTFVVLLMAVAGLAGQKLGIDRGLSVALFPMVILTMVIERLSIMWEERGAGQAMKAAVGTLVAAVLGHLLMTWPPLVYFCFTFPGILLVLAGLMLLMGHYRGYRLSELLRFRAMFGERH